MSVKGYDEHGMPVLFADVPNAGGVVTRKTGSQGGNPRHDTRSGKFASGKKPTRKKAEAPANADPLEWQRMLAAARDAAREFDTPEEGDIREFLQGRAKSPGQVDIAGFLEMVKQQRLADLSDLLDQQFRSTGSMKQGRRKVRVSAPRNYIRKAVGNLSPEEASALGHLLVARGHDEEDVREFFKEKGFDSITFSDADE